MNKGFIRNCAKRAIINLHRAIHSVFSEQFTRGPQADTTCTGHVMCNSVFGTKGPQCVKKFATTIPPNSQPSNYNYFNLIPRPQRSVGCSAQMLVFRNRGNLSVEFYNFWVWGWYGLVILLCKPPFYHKLWNEAEKTWSYTPLVRRINLQMTIVQYKDWDVM
jgi:hypothetical protein